MKRFIAVLSGLLVLPAFAEVAPIYYDEVVEYTDEMIDAVDDEIVEEDVAETSKIVAPRTNVIGRSTSRAVAAGPNTASRTNTSTRAIASSPRNAQSTISRGTVSRATKTTAGVVSRNTATASRAARGANVTSRTAARSAKPVVARAATATRTPVTTTLTDSGNSLYNANARVGVANRRATARSSTASLTTGTTTPVITEEDISTTTNNLTAISELTDYCKAQYASCMDNYCNVLDDNQGRCSCSKNIKNYAATETALAKATEEFQDVVQKIRYIGLTADQVTTLFKETEAELSMSKENDKSTIKSSLDKIRESVLIDASSPKASSYTTSSGISFDLSGLLNMNLSAGSFDLNSLIGNSTNTSSVSNQRGEQLYKTASQRCKTSVLNSCVAQGIDANVITNSYDLEIDKQCIIYENSLNEANAEMRTNARNATNVLQQARLMLAQQKNSYDLRGCVAALDECMQDEYVCGDEYGLCLDSTGKYISDGKLIAGSMPGVAGGSNVNETPLTSSGMSSWTSGGMYDLYATWNYSSDGNTYNAWGAGNDENLNNFIEAIVPNWANNKKATDMATYLLNKIGTIDSKDKSTGMCASVLKQCQDYTYTNKTYKTDNEVVRQYLASALTKIKLKQDSILSDYAENCKSDITSCLTTNGYDTDKSETSTINTQAIRACSSQIATCMSVTGYKPSDPSKLTYTQMSSWTSAMLTDEDSLSGSAYYLVNGKYEICDKGYSCDGTKRTKCTGATYSNTFGSDTCSACPIPQKYAQYYVSNSVHYYDNNGANLHDSMGTCYTELNVPINNGNTVTLVCSASDGDYGTVVRSCRTGGELTCNDGYHFNVNYNHSANATQDYEESLLCDGNSSFSEKSRHTGHDGKYAYSLPDITTLQNEICVADSEQTFTQARKYMIQDYGFKSEEEIRTWCRENANPVGYTECASGTCYDDLF